MITVKFIGQYRLSSFIQFLLFSIKCYFSLGIMKIIFLIYSFRDFFKIRLKFKKFLWRLIKFSEILIICICYFSLLVIFLALVKNFENLVKIKSILMEIGLIFKFDVIIWWVRICGFFITLIWLIELFDFLQRMGIGFSLEWEFRSGEILSDGFFHYKVFL